MSCETRGLPMITTMVNGYYDVNGSDVYPPGTETYGEYCYGMQEICSHMTCGYHGPSGGVRMVNGNGGAIAMPLQVPPGHLVQQVMDENGQVSHIVISPPMPMPVGAHYSPSHASTPLATSAYYAYPQPSYVTASPHYHPQPPGHIQPAMNHQGMHGMMQPPSPQCNGHSSQTGGSSPPPPPTPSTQVPPAQKDNRYQSQTFKYRRKIETHGKDGTKVVILPSQASSLASKKERRKLKDKSDIGIRLNGSSGSTASEDEDMTWVLSKYLSSMTPPTVDVFCRSAVVSWKPPESPLFDIDKKLGLNPDQCNITYEVMMCEKVKEGHLRNVYSGHECHCTITSLKPSTEYYVCLQASLDDVRGSTVKGPIFKTLSVETEAPLPPRLCAKTRNSLTLKWMNVGDVCTKVTNKTFTLEYDEGSGGQNFLAVYSGPLKQFKVTKLLPATCYRFRICVIADKEKSPYSSITSFSTSGNIPSQPQPPVLKQAFLNRLHLEWEKRATDNDFYLQIEDEHMRHGFLTAYNGRETAFVCSGLRGNTEYKFRLCANNEEGSSAWSRIVSYFTLPDKLSCPGKPIPKGRIHASCIRITWEPPRENKQSNLTKYKLEVDRGCGFDTVYTGPDTEYFLENLLPGSTYKFRVACISSTGYSPYSDVNSITTAAVSPGKCAAPRLQSKPEASFLCLEWAHPEYDGGASVSEYEVDMTSPDNITLQAYKGSETLCVINDLSPGRPYLFQVRAYNRVGPGPWSDPLEVISGAGPPDAPRNFSVQCTSPHSCTLFWDEPVNNGAAITRYQLSLVSLSIEDNSDDEDSFKEIYEGLNCQYEVKNMKPATQYGFRIRAVNDAGRGTHSDILLCKTQPSVPSAITTINVSPTATSLGLSWNEPSDNGSEITSYNIELDDFAYSTENAVAELSMEDLIPETLYRVRVQAVNSIGVGTFSQAVLARTLKPPPDAPCVDCVSVTHNSLKLKWGDGKNLDATYFTLEMSSKNKSFVPIYHGTGQSHKVNRLQENTAYNFRICALSESGQGPYSQCYTFTTARAVPPSLRAPKVSNVTDTSCYIEWFGAKQFTGQVYSYQLQLSIEGSSDNAIVYQGSDLKCSLTDLEPQTQYTVRVAAIRHYPDEDLIGAYSPSANFTTIAPLDVCSSLTTTRLQVVPTTTISERRTLRDKQLAAVISFGVTTGACLLAVILEHSLGVSHLS